MTSHPGPIRPAVFFGTLLLAIVMLGHARFTAQRASAADLSEQAQSLRMAPADAAFYSASLRLKEQFDVLVNSRAYAKLMEIPLVQLAKMQAAFQFQQSNQPHIAKVREYIQSPAGQESIAVLKEMFANEVFVYGGDDVTTTLRLLMQLNGVQRTAQLEARATNQEVDELLAKRIQELLEKNAGDFKVPTMVFGFRITDTDRARKQLDEVHALVRNMLDQQQPELSAHLQRDQIGGHEFLTLRLDGTMIPWDTIREQAEDIDDTQIDAWRELLNAKTVALALGVVDNFVLLSVADSTDHLQTLGSGKYLNDQPAIQRLAKHTDQRLAAIGYMSQGLAESMGSPDQTVDEMATSLEAGLREAEVDEDLIKQLVDDVRGLDLSRYVPKQGETSNVVFLTDRGYEGYQYSAGTQPMIDASKPLTILDHAGGNPMLVAATRSNDTIEDYDAAVAWLRKTAQHVEKIVESKSTPEDWAKYMQYRDRAIDLLRRLNDANREYMYPAFADNQGALVVDVAATGKQWISMLPESPKPLPMIEIGMVTPVSDAGRLRQGAQEYYAVLRDAIALLREIEPEKVPEFDLKRPQERSLDGGGTLHIYPLPPEWGVDPQLAPNAGLADSVAAISMLPSMTERLLRTSPLEVDTALDFKRPAGTIFHFQVHKMIDAIRPWIDYGLDVAMGNLKNDDPDANADEASEPQSPMMLQLGFIVPQVQQFLDVASALRSVSSVSYLEDNLWVTHSETHFQDLK